MKQHLSLRGVLPLLATACLLMGCGEAAYYSTGGVVAPGEPDRVGVSGEGLANLLTGQVVGDQEQQLRDNLQREIVLDFPIRVGVVYYQLESSLDRVDQEALLEQLRDSFSASGVIKETLIIPQGFINGEQNLDTLRLLGSRFQTDVLLIVTGKHDFAPSRDQASGFFSSFSDAVAYESKVSLEALALDVFTGTLLKPFDVSASGERVTLSSEATDFQDRVYDYKKTVEQQAWWALEAQVLEGFKQLKTDVEARLASAE